MLPHLRENIAKNLQMQDSTEYQQWQEQLNDAYLPAEITCLFSRTVENSRRTSKEIDK